jgi:cytochrome c553
MRSIGKWLLRLFGVIVLFVVVFYVIAYFNTQSRINKAYQVNVQHLAIPTDSASYTKGKHIAENRGCMGCHGANFASGRVFPAEGTPIGNIYAQNITSGKGGIQYTDDDWVRVIRHGLNKENKPLWFMPSNDICVISNEELAQLICFMKAQPPVDKEIPQKDIKPLGRVLTFLHKFPLLPAEVINHEAVYKDQITPSITPAYGAYLSTVCQGCHGAHFEGAPAHSKDEPNIPNLTLNGPIAGWRENDFIKALRSGTKPDGQKLSVAMPWQIFTYTDDELKAIYAYLHQLK